jgi:catechol 2,3-dioxygenase-like lactoylglutathione lyase family enzyme
MQLKWSHVAINVKDVDKKLEFFHWRAWVYHQ